MKNPMMPFEGKIFTSVDEGYNVTVYHTPKNLQDRLLKLGEFCNSSDVIMTPVQIMKELERTGVVRLYERDDYGNTSSDWSYRVEVH